MKKLILLVTLASLFSCFNQKEIEARAKHQAETGNRVNEAHKNTGGLFEELDKNK
ncbi:MAG: hypothetical protein K0R25_916 [Rickettsiaceae bacterium]|jgi:hypothetical protein|nr:hypothetical protein [Rickettsiaceae bacterium]